MQRSYACWALCISSASMMDEMTAIFDFLLASLMHCRSACCNPAVDGMVAQRGDVEHQFKHRLEVSAIHSRMRSLCAMVMTKTSSVNAMQPGGVTLAVSGNLDGPLLLLERRPRL